VRGTGKSDSRNDISAEPRQKVSRSSPGIKIEWFFFTMRNGHRRCVVRMVKTWCKPVRTSLLHNPSISWISNLNPLLLALSRSVAVYFFLFKKVERGRNSDNKVCTFLIELGRCDYVRVRDIVYQLCAAIFQPQNTDFRKRPHFIHRNRTPQIFGKRPTQFRGKVHTQPRV
jgi:hypothetical protein